MIYTLESLKLQNGAFDCGFGLEQGNVDYVNSMISLIENSRGESPCPGDIIEHTDEYGTYSPNALVMADTGNAGRLSVYGSSLPFVFKNSDNQGVHFDLSGGPEFFVDPDMPRFIGKREKQFRVFVNCGATKSGSIYFTALVNAWEYVAPDQMHPGYSTKNWARQYISYRQNPVDSDIYRYHGQDVAFVDTREYELWKRTYRAVDFLGKQTNHSAVFFYRETDTLISREEWDALPLPLDTRFCNGVIYVKAAYDDDNHMITTYRYTNSGFPASKRLEPFERAKGTALTAPTTECPPGKSCKGCGCSKTCPHIW